jgi:hypothetical protein
MTALERVREYIMTHPEFRNVDIVEFMRFHSGQLSVRTRISDVGKELKAKGGKLISEKVRGQMGVYQYKVILPLKTEPDGQVVMQLEKV